MDCAMHDNYSLRPARLEDLGRLCEIAVATWQGIYDQRRKLVGPDIFETMWKDWPADKAGFNRSRPSNVRAAKSEGSHDVFKMTDYFLRLY